MTVQEEEGEPEEQGAAHNELISITRDAHPKAIFGLCFSGQLSFARHYAFGILLC